MELVIEQLQIFVNVTTVATVELKVNYVFPRGHCSLFQC